MDNTNFEFLSCQEYGIVYHLAQLPPLLWKASDKTKWSDMIPNHVDSSIKESSGITSGINEILESGNKTLTIILVNFSVHP